MNGGCSTDVTGGDRGGQRGGSIAPAVPRGEDPTFVERCKKLAGERLLGPGATLFREQTGLRLHVAWAPCGVLSWDEFSPEFCTRTCPPEVRGRPGDARCAEFDHNHLRHLLSGPSRSRGFVCPFHVRTVACKIQAGDLLLGIAFFQSFEPPKNGAGHPPAGDLQRMRHLLNFVVHDAVETVMARIGREMIDGMKEELAAMRRKEDAECAFPHGAAGEHDSTGLESRSHADLIVRRILDYANALYGRPIGLAGFADEVGMNLSYLSHLFSTTMGMPFRSYLRQLRMDRARRLLADPMQRISDIAYAVGYSDPNRFRLDFKRMTGLPPSKWRERFASGG